MSVPRVPGAADLAGPRVLGPRERAAGGLSAVGWRSLITGSPRSRDGSDGRIGRASRRLALPDLRWSPRSGTGTADPLEELLAPGYFGAVRGLLRPGDLVYVRARADGERLAGAEAAVRMALLMVRAGARGSVAGGSSRTSAGPTTSLRPSSGRPFWPLRRRRRNAAAAARPAAAIGKTARSRPRS